MKNLFLMKRALNDAGVKWHGLTESEIEGAFAKLENKSGLPPVDRPVPKRRGRPAKPVDEVAQDAVIVEEVPIVAPEVKPEVKAKALTPSPTTPEMLEQWANIAQNLKCCTKMTLILSDGSTMILEVKPNA